MQWLEQKYIGLLSNRLERFTRKSGSLYNFRCPLCGDSQTNRTKARGYIYKKKGKSVFHCHNCNATLSVPNFIKTLDQTLYNEYVVERLKDEKSPQQQDLEAFVNKMKPPTFISDGPLKGLKKVSQLSPDSKIKQYVVNRMIPNKYHAKLFACPNFAAFTNNLIPGKFSEKTLEKDETRLLIPFINAEKRIHAYQGRALNANPLKYITIVLDESTPKVYGLDTTNFNDRVYVFEGPFDSMFIDNSIATAGGDIVSTLHGFDKSNLVIVYDNEPRSRDTIKKLDKAINQGYSVCIWPENLQHKDINDMVQAGMSSAFLKHIIDQHTYKDLAAKMALKRWSKI